MYFRQTATHHTPARTALLPDSGKIQAGQYTVSHNYLYTLLLVRVLRIWDNWSLQITDLILIFRKLDFIWMLFGEVSSTSTSIGSASQRYIDRIGAQNTLSLCLSFNSNSNRYSKLVALYIGQKMTTCQCVNAMQQIVWTHPWLQYQGGQLVMSNLTV